MIKKKCSLCNLEKKLSEFYEAKNQRYKDGYKSRCKECCNTKAAEYRENNREKIREQHLKFREQHRDTRFLPRFPYKTGAFRRFTWLT